MTRTRVEQEEAVAMDAALRIADDLRSQAHDEASATIAEAVRGERGRLGRASAGGSAAAGRLRVAPWGNAPDGDESDADVDRVPAARNLFGRRCARS